MSKRKRKKNNVLEAQKRAIRANYARIAQERKQKEGLVSVDIKTHRDKSQPKLKM